MFFDCTQDGCGKVFNCKKALKEHERTHNQDRPFKCDLCDQTFTQYSSLQKHARVHDKKKPFKCSNNGCNQAFSQVSNLIRHQRIHTGEKPYECEICGKQFASGSNLKQHVQIHDRQESRNQYKCIFQGCDKSYLYPSSLKKHYTVSHKEEYEKYLDDQQIETCGFHLKAQEPFSHNLKLNNPSDQTLESNQDIQTGPNNEKGLQSSNTLRSSQRQRTQSRVGYGKSAGADQAMKHEDLSQLSINQGSTLLPSKRNFQYRTEDQNQVRMRPEDQLSKALEGANALKRFKTSADILPMGQGIPYQGSQLSTLNPSALADINNQKLSEDLQKSLYLTCHMYFINNQNNHNSGQPLDPQIQQSLSALKNNHPGLGDLHKGKMGLDQGIESAPGILNSQDQKAGSSSQSSNKDPMLAINHIANQQKAYASIPDQLVSDNNFNNIDPSIRLQNKQYQNSLVQQVQNILENQNQAFNRNMENQHFMGDAFSFQNQGPLSQSANTLQQVTLPLHLPRPLMQSTGGPQINSPAGLAFHPHPQNHNFINSRLERISNNSQNIYSPSVYLGKSNAANNHGSNNSNHSFIRSSQFKYRAKALNDIRKPTPMREGQSTLTLQPCGMISNDGNQPETVGLVGNGGSGGTASNRKSSQFFNATGENDSKNGSGEKEVEYEENDEEEHDDALPMKRMNVETNLLQANFNQEIEDINRQTPQLYHSLSSGAKPSAFSQVRKPNPSGIGASLNIGNPGGAANNISVKRSSSENSLNMNSNNLDPHPLNIQDIRKCYFYNQTGILSENMESKDQSFDKSGFSSKNLDQVVAANFAALRNNSLPVTQTPKENNQGSVQ